MAIPKIIHQIWFQGWNNLPEKYNKNVSSVIKQNPDWEHKTWDDCSLRIAISSLGKEYLEKYEGFQHIYQKIDFGRYAILYIYGGVSVDVDVFAYKNFNETPFINEKDFIVSYNSSNAFENYIKSGKSLLLNNATILVSKNNQILKNLLDHILTLSCDLNQSKESCINSTTGPKEFTEYLNGFKDQITILDNSYFEPCQGSDEYCEIKPNSILDHRHENGWVSPLNKKILSTWCWIKGHRKGIIIAVIVIILLICIYRISKT